MRNIACCVVVCALLGCDSDNQPKFSDLHSVHGTLLQAGQPVSGGAVQFKSDPEKPEFLINSEVAADGTFQLTTVRTTDSRGERRRGAPPGKYTVTYLPNLGDQTAGYKGPVVLPEPIVVEAQDNELKIELP